MWCRSLLAQEGVQPLFYSKKILSLILSDDEIGVTCSCYLALPVSEP